MSLFLRVMSQSTIFVSCQDLASEFVGLFFALHPSQHFSVMSGRVFLG